MSDPQIEFSIQSDVKLVAFVGRAISALLNGTAMPSHRIATFELAVVEVVTNVIEHAYQYQYGQPLEQEVVERYTTEKVEIQKPGQLIADLPDSGWGTSLVAKLCDEVRYEQLEGTNVLTLVCHIDCEADQAVPGAI